MTTPDNELVVIGPWMLRPHVAETQAAYARIAHGGAEDCTCEPCANWVAVRERAFPPDARSLCARLDVDWQKEAEAAHMCRSDGGHLYSGWLHCVAEWLSGPDAGAASESFALGAHFTLRLTRQHLPMLEPFRGTGPLVALDFLATVPWVLASPEPE